MNAPFPRHRNGFTIVEILVVVSILLVLAALIAMLSRNLRGSADKVKAIRNISQLQLANATYAAENNGKYVPTHARPKGTQESPWFSNPRFLACIVGDGSTLKNSLQEWNTVPPHLLDPIAYKAKGKSFDMYSASFGYIDCLPEPSSGDISWSTGQIVSPEKSAAFITATDFRVRYSGRSLWKNNRSEGKTGDGRVAYRHSGKKAVAVYYDGHVAELSMKEILAYDDQGGINHPFWNASAP